jgi:hypothetical protein
MHASVKGDAKFRARHNGATYFFASKDHREGISITGMRLAPVDGARHIPLTLRRVSRDSHSLLRSPRCTHIVQG